ncbi:MAG: dihydrofolate reductase [Candidatus Liberibacter ctenarytainae]|uniref:Dihydrofolate reductase n=1 Tax=Candidatus Liberibacter ctenarytainae TaxID=2020335 RepID=A0A937ACL4_9HYPH|nr:dihydrofolate reductase [Candidatus Liberibacter ctenarytainae]
MSIMQKVILIAAIARNNVIGNRENIPWKISSDLKRFKSLTWGNPIIMGYKTFQSIGKPLPGRCNILITTNKMQNISVIDRKEIAIAHSLENAFTMAVETGSEKIFVVGGGQIYAQTIDLAHQLYITHVEAEIAGDVFFPMIDSRLWQKQEEEIILPAGMGDSYPTRFAIYNRRIQK